MLSFEREQDRVRSHLAAAEQYARSRDVSRLSYVTRLIRALLLDALSEYRERGRFPLNHHSNERTPIFVDEHGTRCAVAHLLELGGAAALVASVQHASNYAFVPELAAIPELATWLTAAGLSIEEAARIQPSYCPAAEADCVCNMGWAMPLPKAVAVLDGHMNGGLLEIEAIHGSTSAYAIGDKIPVQAYTAVASDAHVLVPLAAGHVRVDAGTDAAGNVAPFGIVVNAEGKPMACTVAPFAGDLPITAANVVTALQSNDCAATLAALDAGWAAAPECMENVPENPKPGVDAAPADDAAVAKSDAGSDSGTKTSAASAPASDDGGCSVGAISDVAATEILLAVTGALLAARRMRRG